MELHVDCIINIIVEIGCLLSPKDWTWAAICNGKTARDVWSRLSEPCQNFPSTGVVGLHKAHYTYPSGLGTLSSCLGSDNMLKDLLLLFNIVNGCQSNIRVASHRITEIILEINFGSMILQCWSTSLPKYCEGEAIACSFKWRIWDKYWQLLGAIRNDGMPFHSVAHVVPHSGLHKSPFLCYVCKWKEEIMCFTVSPKSLSQHVLFKLWNCFFKWKIVQLVYFSIWTMCISIEVITARLRYLQVLTCFCLVIIAKVVRKSSTYKSSHYLLTYMSSS